MVRVQQNVTVEIGLLKSNKKCCRRSSRNLTTYAMCIYYSKLSIQYVSMRLQLLCICFDICQHYFLFFHYTSRWTDYVFADSVPGELGKGLGYDVKFESVSNHCCHILVACVRPLLEFLSTAWDPHLAKDVHQLECVQRWAARFVMNDYCRTTSVTSFLNQLEWSPLSVCRRNSHLVAFYKAVNNLSPVPVGQPCPCSHQNWSHDPLTFTGKSTQFVRPGKFMKVSYNDSLSDKSM